MIKIAIAEDNQLSSKILRDKLSVNQDIKIVDSAKNGQELIDLLFINNDIDLILMDIEMPILNGIDATEIIKKLYNKIKIIIITMHDGDDFIFNAIKAGADSYILKDTKSEKIYETICDTLKGGSVMSPSIAIKTLQFLKNIDYTPKSITNKNIKLSDRENEILELISQGLTNKIIANKLCISPFTVKRHIENIYQKLHSHNRIEMLDKARKNGLI